MCYTEDGGLEKRVTAMKCEFCKGETKLRKVKKPHWLKGKLYIVENVEAEVCAEWGKVLPRQHARSD